MTASDGDAARRAAAGPRPAIGDRIAPARVFELPPPTASRLTLAQLALGAAALFAASWFLVFRAGVAGAADCTTQAATTARYLACTKRAFTEEGWLLLAGPAALAVLASAGWLAAPAVLTRWRAVVSIPDGPVRSALDALACESGERRAPEWCTGSGADAWTFGRSPRYRVVLARAMVRRMLREGPAPLRAVVLHELGHLRNRDVDQTYVTLCGIVVFGMFIAVPLAVDAVVMGWALGLSLGWRLLALVVLVLLTGAAALRSRERDADLRAAVTDRAAMVAAVRASAARRGRTPSRSRGWRSPLRLHPDDALRLAAVEDPGRAMAVSWPEFLAAGVAAGVVLVETPSVLQDLFGAGPTSQYAVAGWLTALPLARVVGLGAWRSAAVSTHPGLVLPGVALGAGLVLGSQLAPRSSATWQAIFATARDREFSPALDDVAPASAVWLVGLALMIGVLWTLWAGALGARVRGRGRAVVTVVLLVEATVVALPLGGWFLTLRLAASSGASVGGLATALAGSGGVLAMIAVVACAAVVLVRPRSRPTLGGLVVVVGAVALVGAIAVPAAFGSPPLEPSAGVAPPASVPLPPSTQLANACSWLTSIGSPLLLAIDSGDQRHLADYLVRVDDPLIRRFGAELRDSAAEPEGPVAMQVRAALINRCDDFRNTRH